MDTSILTKGAIPFISRNRIPLLALVIFFTIGIIKPIFLSPINMSSLFDSMAAYGITAVGLTFVMLCGQLDISIGSVMALTSCVFMQMLPVYGFALSALAMLALGCVLGAITGFFVSFFRLSPFIVSMCMQIAYRGVALTITKNTPVSVPNDATLRAISRAHIANIPAAFFIFVLIVIIAQFVLSRTKFGRNLFIIGGNINVADSIGIKVRNHLWAVFVIQGLCAALGGIIMMTRTFSASGNLASEALFSVIPTVIVGGTAFSGGKGGAVRTLYGVLLMSIIYNAMTMFSLYINFQQLIRGIILLLIIVSDKYIENRHKKV
ncbi:MAG: ABC transporter permease [Treponema sp.]|jgi:ribose/xylose/arabinose/galactoside ABC-type transport system permease subunit|nr:ABC transporter permease [Treponema sp.]